MQVNQELLKFCKKEIQNLLDKKLIRKIVLRVVMPFYVHKQAELERDVPRLVINQSL